MPFYWFSSKHHKPNQSLFQAKHMQGQKQSSQDPPRSPTGSTRLAPAEGEALSTGAAAEGTDSWSPLQAARDQEGVLEVSLPEPQSRY